METSSAADESLPKNINYATLPYLLPEGDVGLKIHNPNASGLEIIADHYRKKYGIDIRVFEASTLDSFGEFMTLYKDHILKLTSSRIGALFGFVLYSEGHTLSLIATQNPVGKNNIIILDSINNNSHYQYHASLCKDFDFFSIYNGETRGRQSSSLGCKIDAISTLKDALRIDICKEIAPRIIKPAKREVVDTQVGLCIEEVDPLDCAHESLTEDDEEKEEVIENFHLFRLPEELLKTAQNSAFLRESAPNYKIPLSTTKSGAITLEEKRAKHSHSLSFDTGETSKSYNFYIQQKSCKYASLMDQEPAGAYAKVFHKTTKPDGYPRLAKAVAFAALHEASRFK